ncbi:hypothetical protein ACCO45_013195 [Purpureocillium lilacinum]|uniref:Uncharacterized protein n=1 Tax=Purpureocillium lilacinum TaxID=33203 RepID=A0ACC4DBN7_PURLI
MGEQIPVRTKPQDEGGARSPFGGALKKDFPIDPEWHNLNHGSFGTLPKAVLARLRHYQDAAEARPDSFIRYDYPKLLDESRVAVAALVNAPVETVVFVSNATEGVNTVIKNLAWNDDAKDVILTFSTAYEACAKVADYIVDSTGGKVEHREITIDYPLEDEEILQAFREAVKAVEKDGKRARVCIFDVVSSRPGVAFPYIDMIKVCKELGVISMVDGAQGIGMVPLDLTNADPDFFVSNCHKWLHHLIPTTLATSHGYIPKSIARGSPLPPSAKGQFVNNFEFVGTKDNGPYLCVKDGIAWRRDVLGSEDKILTYLWDLNKKGIKDPGKQQGNNDKLLHGQRCSADLDRRKGSQGAKESDAVVATQDQGTAFQWMSRTMVDDYKTFMSLFVLGNRYWIRISASVYLDMADYEVAGKVLKELSARVAKKEYLST